MWGGDPFTVTRREVLAAVASGTVFGLAGCAGDDEADSSPDEGDGNPFRASSTPASRRQRTTPSPTRGGDPATPSGGSHGPTTRSGGGRDSTTRSGGSRGGTDRAIRAGFAADIAEDLDDPTGPELAVARYMQAVKEGDVEAANAVAVEGTPFVVEELPAEQREFELTLLTECTAEEIVADRNPEASTASRRTLVDSTLTNVESFVEEEGYDDYAYVCTATTDAEGGEREGWVIVVKDGDQWYLHTPGGR